MLILLPALLLQPQTAALPAPLQGRREDADPAVVRFVVDPAGPERWFDALARRHDGPAPANGARLLGGLAVTHHAGGATPEGDAPASPTFTPDGSRLLVPHWESRNLIEWDVASGAFVRAIALSGSPLDVAVTPDGLRALTANGFEDTLSFVDLVSGAETGTLALGNQPGIVAISPTGAHAAVGNTGEGTLSIVDLATGLELHRVGGLSYAMLLSINFESGAVSPHFPPFAFAGPGRVVHADRNSNRVAIVDVFSGALTTVATPAAPEGIAVSAAGNTAVALCSTGQAVAVIDVASATLTKTIVVGDNFGGAIAVDPLATKAVVGVLNAVKVVNLVTNAVGPALSGTAEEITTTADGLHAYCTGFSGQLVSYATGAVVRTLNGLTHVGFGAVSPAGPRAVGISALFGEDLLLFDTNGAAGGLVRRHMSGPAPEGDRTRMLAVSPDGTRVALAHTASDSVGLHDADTGALLWHVSSGDRPGPLAFTRDGSLVVATNLDSSHLSVIDVATGIESEVPISQRAHQVALAPDGSFAYAVTATSDGVWRVDLATRTVAGPQLPTGDTGAIGFLHQQTSGMTLSHDGATLAVCGSFSNTLTLIDTASWSVLANVPVAGFPVRAIFDARDENILVSARDADVVRVVRNLGPASSVVTSYATGDQPFELALTLDSERLFVGNFGASTVRVIATATGATLRTIPFADALGGLALSNDGAELYLATGNWSVSFGPGPLFSRASNGSFRVFDARTYDPRGALAHGFAPGGLDLAQIARTALVPSVFLDGFSRIELPARRGPRAR